MEIVVLVKAVPEGETRLRSDPAGTSLDTEGIKWVLAGYDESAVEQALLLKEAVPGSRVRVISFGPAPRTEEVLRASLALGCDAAAWSEHPPNLRPDPATIARHLSKALGAGAVDLLLAGKQAGDDEAGLVGPALAELRGIPSYGGVTDLRWNAEKGRFTFRRSVEGGLESVESPGPLLVGLQQAWNDPRTAKLPNILRSRKAPIEKIAYLPLSGEGATSTGTVAPARFRLPAPRTGAKMIEFKTPDEAAAKLVKILREDAKVFP